MRRYPNPNPASRARIPFHVALPSDLLGTLDTTVAAPLRLKTERDVVPVLRLNPVVHVGDQTYFLWPQEFVATLTHSLKNPVANLSAQRMENLAALDFFMAGFCRRPNTECLWSTRRMGE